MTRKWTAVAVALLAVILCAAALAVSAQHHADGSGRLQQRTADADFDDAQADKPPAAPSDKPPTLEDIDRELAGVRGYQKFLSDIRPKVAAGQKTAVVDGETIPLPTAAELAAEEKQAAAYVERLIELRKKIAAGQTPSRAAAINFLTAAASSEPAERVDGSELSEVEVDVDDSALADLHERLLTEADGESAMQSEQARLARMLAAELLAEAAAMSGQSDRADLSEPAASLDVAQLRGPCPAFHRAYPLRGRGERRFWRSRPFGDFLLFPEPGVMCVPRRLIWRVERILARGGPGPWGRGGHDQRTVPVLIDDEAGLTQPQPQPQVGVEYPAPQVDSSALAIDADAIELDEAASRSTWRQWLDGGANDARWEEHSEL